MAVEAMDPFEALGVAEDAEIEEIRAAYHLAALKCHPDTNPQDPTRAARMFARVTEAYRSCLRTHRFRRPAHGPREPALNAREAAARQAERMAAVADYVEATNFQAARGRVRRKITRPRVDETLAFVLLWPVAILLAVGAATLVAIGIDASPAIDSGVIAMMGVYVVVYVASLVAVVLGVVLTREVVTLAMQFVNYCTRRALPGGSPKLPKRSRRWLRWRRV